MLSRLLNTLEKTLLPHYCVLCHEKAEEQDLCPPCAAELPHIEQACPQCAMPLAGEITTSCGACQDNPPYYDRTIALFYYQDPIIKMVSQFKFHDKLLYGKLFSTLLIDKIKAQQEALPDLLLPIPLHASRLRERGFNQALELARPLAKIFSLKLNYRDLLRTRATQQQSMIEKNDRASNVKNAFTLRQKISAKHVGLIDDVMTTGHTLNECAKVLKKQGVEKVTVFAVARTSLK
jgi:ComF family protein